MIIKEFKGAFFEKEAYIWQGRYCVWHVNGNEEICLMKQADEDLRRDEIVRYGNIPKATSKDFWFQNELNDLRMDLKVAENSAISTDYSSPAFS